MVVGERISITGNDLVEKVDKLIRQGNVQKVRIMHLGKPLMDISLDLHDTASDVPLFLIPVHAAISKITELINYCTIEVDLVDRRFAYEYPDS